MMNRVKEFGAKSYLKLKLKSLVTKTTNECFQVGLYGRKLSYFRMKYKTMMNIKNLEAT